VFRHFFFIIWTNEKNDSSDIKTRKRISRKKGDAIMRVEAYNQVAQLYNREKTQKVQSTKQLGSRRDEVQISSMGRDYQIAKQAVADASDIREDRVAQLKERLDSGNYNVDMNDFANKLLEKYNALVK
jgi:negative regulator of flagellin synthesis FlgM